MGKLSDSRIIRPKKLRKRLDVSRTTLWRWEQQGKIPPKRKLGPNAVGWLESDLDDWWASKEGAGDTGTEEGGG